MRSLCFRKNNNEFNQVHEYAFGHFLYQFHQIVLCISIYLTVSLALERYRAVWRPVEYHNRCKAYRDVWNGNSKTYGMTWQPGPILKAPRWVDRYH